MSLVLTGGLAHPATPKSPLVSPGMLQIPCTPSNLQTISNEHLQLNQLLYPNNMFLNGLLSPGSTPSAVPGWELLLPPQQQYIMLPGHGVQRLLPPSLPLNPPQHYFLPPPPLNTIPRPQFQVPFSLPPPTIQQSVKRTHDQAFQSQLLEGVPPKRPPVLYTPVSSPHGAPGLLPNPPLPSQIPYSQL